MKLITNILARSSAGFESGFGLVEKIKAVATFPFISIFTPLHFKGTKFGKTYEVEFSSGSDIAMWKEVFCDEEYIEIRDANITTVLDIGANVGFTSLYISLINPEANIIAVEPDPSNFHLLNKNTSKIKNISLIQGAVSDAEGERDFFVYAGSGMSSSFLSRSKDGQRKIKVKTVSLASLIERSLWQRISLIKFDVEGAEMEIFKNTPLDRVDALIGEYHEDLVVRSVSEFLELFPQFKNKIRKVGAHRFVVYLFR